MAPNPTNYSEIQNDEIQVLRSIYMDDFLEEEAKTGAWNRATDRSFRIKIRSTAIDDGDGKVLTLKVSFPPTYPKTVPQLAVESGSDLNLRPKVWNDIEDVLKTKPQSLLGSEMIFEIATALQDILDCSSGDGPKDAPTLDEERAGRERAARQAADQLEAKQRRQALEQQVEEEKMLQDLVKQREATLVTRDNSASIGIHKAHVDTNTPGLISFDRPSGPSSLFPRGDGTPDVIHGKATYRCGPICTVSTVRPFQSSKGTDDDQGPPFLILKECQISLSSGNESHLKRSIQNLETKLDVQTGLIPHQSISKPLNYRIKKQVDSRDSPSWTVSILMELATRHSLRDTLEIVDNLDIKTIRAWSIRLIEGLQHYHRHGCAHASVHLNNILLEKSDTEQGERKTTIPKLADGGFERDLCILKTGTAPQFLPPTWMAPETMDESDGFLPATDVWNFGVCFLQMAFGLAITQHQSPFALCEDLKLTASLRALLNQIFQIEPKKRPSAWDLLHYEFFRNDDALLHNGE